VIPSRENLVCICVHRGRTLFHGGRKKAAAFPLDGSSDYFLSIVYFYVDVDAKQGVAFTPRGKWKSWPYLRIIYAFAKLVFSSVKRFTEKTTLVLCLGIIKDHLHQHNA